MVGDTTAAMLINVKLLVRKWWGPTSSEARQLRSFPILLGILPLQFPIMRHIETTPQTSLHTGELVTGATNLCIPNNT